MVDATRCYRRIDLVLLDYLLLGFRYPNISCNSIDGMLWIFGTARVCLFNIAY